MRHLTIAGTWGMVLLILAVIAAPAQAAVEPSSRLVSPLKGNRILIVASNPEAGAELGDIFTEMYQVDVTVKKPAQYDPYIDAYYYDGLVYLGTDYDVVPKPGLLHDVEKTTKPVLWIDYHGWLLDGKFQSSRHIAIKDEHDSGFDFLLFEGKQYKLPEPVDGTVVSVANSDVIYWLDGGKNRREPGAFHVGNFTYINYAPGFDIYQNNFLPFLHAVRAAFGFAVPPKTPKPPDFAQRLAAARRDSYQTGIHMPVYEARTTDKMAGYDSDEWHANLMRIKNAGAEWVDLVRTYYQTDIHSSDIHADPQQTPTLDSLKNVIGDAHRLGLLVRLHIAINLTRRGPDDWHGLIHPNNRPAWWKAFDAIALNLASFAERQHVESLMIGTEFTSMQNDDIQWRSLIRSIRKRYNGLIGYGVNYNSMHLDWANDLDFFSVSAYWPLAKHRDPSMQTLDASWNRIGKTLERWKLAHPKLPLELGEVGYVSQPYASVLPFSWKANRGGAQDLQEQLRCYKSLYYFMKRARYIRGIHFFASTAEDTDPTSTGYTPFGKPAEKVLREIIHLR